MVKLHTKRKQGEVTVERQRWMEELQQWQGGRPARAISYFARALTKHRSPYGRILQ